jgi:hypothetical protein
MKRYDVAPMLGGTCSVGQVGNLRPIVNRPSEVSCALEERRLATAAQDAILPHKAPLNPPYYEKALC